MGTSLVSMQSASYSIGTGDIFDILLVASTAPQTAVILPPPVSGKRFVVKNVGSGTVVVTALGPAKLNGAIADPIVLEVLGSLEVVSDGTDWHVINRANSR